MQSQTVESRDITAELKVVDIKAATTSARHLFEELQQERQSAIIKGRLARQRRFEIEELFNRLKKTEQNIAVLERALREIRPHFFPDHPISALIERALSENK